ncbi:MAG: major capsid protein [Magnetococcales bacterium]|nr:major capsid protein [Magnetococcales bacterium]
MPINLAQVRLIDPILSNVVQGYKNAEMVGKTLFPEVPVTVSGGQVIEFGKEAFKRYMARRVPGAATKRIQFGYAGKPFALVQDALEGTVPKEHLRDAQAVPGIDLATRCTNTVMRSLTLNLEYEQAVLATTPGNYDSNHKVTLTGTNKWSDAGSDPFGDMNDGKEAVRLSVGIYPNTLLLSAVAFNALKEHPKVLDRFKYTSRESVTTEMLAALWDLGSVVVGRAVMSDDDGNNLDIWGNNAVLAYVPQQSSGIEEPSYGYTYTMQGHPQVEMPYYENNARSWIYPVTYERVPVLSGITSGFLFATPA